MEELPIYFILAGQSNAAGRAYGKDLSDDLQKEYPDVMMRWNNDMNFGNPAVSNEWKALQPQFTPFAGQTQFGPEIILGRRLYDHFKRPIRIIKFTMGSTNLAINWNPNGKDVVIGKKKQINYFNEFTNFCQTAITSLNGKADFGGIFWMQGEGDAMDKKFADSYYDNFKSLTAKFREMYGDCPIVAGLVNWPAKYQNIVNDAITKLASEDKKLFTVNTSDFTTIGFSYDPKYNNHHFDAESLNKLGQRMADEYLKNLI